MKLRTKKQNAEPVAASIVGPAIRGRRHGVEFVDVPQPGMVITNGSVCGSVELLAGAYVKVSPTLRSSERAGYDSQAVRERLLAAGAVAVVVVPVVVPDSVEDVRRAAAPTVAPKLPEQHLRDWFDGVKGVDPTLVSRAMDEAAATVCEVGL